MGGLLADRTRAAFCLALMDGRAWTVSEVARQAGVAASTASEHLDRLVAGGLLVQERQGRHRYLRLAGAETASLIESLTAAAGHPDQRAASARSPRHPTPVRSLSAANRRRTLAYARTCYDHLAGVVGVAVTDAMTRASLLTWDRGLALTADGTAWLADLGIDIASLATGRRPLVRSCLDWTERRPHLAGAVGAAVCRHAFAAGWITRVGTTRAVAVTPAGRDALAQYLGIDEETVALDTGAATTAQRNVVDLHP